MVRTAIPVEPSDRDALNATHAARIPPACRELPTAIESRAKTLRFVAAAGFTDSPSTQLHGAFVTTVLPRGRQVGVSARRPPGGGSLHAGHLDLIDIVGWVQHR